MTACNINLRRIIKLSDNAPPGYRGMEQKLQQSVDSSTTEPTVAKRKEGRRKKERKRGQRLSHKSCDSKATVDTVSTELTDASGMRRSSSISSWAGLSLESPVLSSGGYSSLDPTNSAGHDSHRSRSSWAGLDIYTEIGEFESSEPAGDENEDSFSGVGETETQVKACVRHESWLNFDLDDLSDSDDEEEEDDDESIESN